MRIQEGTHATCDEFCNEDLDIKSFHYLLFLLVRGIDLS